MNYVLVLINKIKGLICSQVKSLRKDIETEIKETVKEEIKNQISEVVTSYSTLIKDQDITPKLKETLIKNGIENLEDLKKVKDLTDISGIGEKKAQILKKLIK